MMDITIILNGKKVQDQIEPDMALLDFVREHGCYSVKRGCESSNCGLCGHHGHKDLEFPSIKKIFQRVLPSCRDARVLPQALA